MNDIIFARPRHNYQSYTDLWRLVQLSGFPLIFIDEIDPKKDCTYIFTHADASISFEKGRAKIINWLLEWYPDYRQQPGVNQTWHSSEWFARKIKAKYVPMGGHPGLVDLPFRYAPKQYDVATLWYAPGRRGEMLGKLIAKGLKLAPNGWGEDRSELLYKSRMKLLVHQHGDFKAVAPLRACIAAAHEIPFVVESGNIDDFYKQSILEFTYDEMPEMIPFSLSCEKELKLIARRAFKNFCQTNNFERMVHQAL